MAGVGASPFSPAGKKVAAKRPDEGVVRWKKRG